MITSPLTVGHYIEITLETYHEIFCNTSRYMNSFFPNTIKSWNGIVNEFQACTSLGIFKRSIFNLVRPTPKSIYGIHDHSGLKCLFQLRVGLSLLKCHKKSQFHGYP